MTISLLFRVLFAAIFFTGFAIATTHRTRAQMKGGSVSEASENRIIYIFLRGGGLLLWLSFFLYIFYPPALAWSFVPLPTWARWVGVGLGITMLPLTAWAALSIGKNVTRTVLTRTDHELVTWGAYRYVRHPLYSFGMVFFFSLGLISTSGLMLGGTVLALVLILLRLPHEESMLIDAFGDAYYEYRRTTGALIPKIG